MTQKLICILFFILALVAVPVLSYSVVVDWVSGDVTYSHLKSDWEKLDSGMTLVSGDIIKTGAGSEATLIDDGSEMHIMANSKFTISEKYVQEQKRPSFMLFLGRMKFKLGKTAKNEPDIQTQTVNLTIRGTEFEVGSGFDGSTIVLLNEGSVAVQGRKSELVLQQGEGTQVAFGEEPTEKFDVMTRVIDWDKWLAESRESIKGNEISLLKKILVRFQEIDADIKKNEIVRQDAQKKKDEFIKERDKLLDEGNKDLADQYSKKAGEQSRFAFHAFVNIRFLALSSIGLFDMAERIYTGLEKPPKEATGLFEEIKTIYKNIEAKYLYEGDRERLEKKAEKKKGCSKLF